MDTHTVSGGARWILRTRSGSDKQNSTDKRQRGAEPACDCDLHLQTKTCFLSLFEVVSIMTFVKTLQFTVFSSFLVSKMHSLKLLVNY